VATTQTTEAHPIPLSPGDWRVDPARSELGFLTRIIFGLAAVRGRYSGFDGELHIDGAGNASGVLRRAPPAHDIRTHGAHPQCRWQREAGRNASHSRPSPSSRYARLRGPGGLRRAAHHADFEVDHGTAGFEIKRLPRTVRIQAALTLNPTG
jgi:hypothetical protein